MTHGKEPTPSETILKWDALAENPHHYSTKENGR